MNWDGRRYGLPNFGFKKVALGLCLTFYGPLMVTLGAILILALKYVPLQLKAINEYLRLSAVICLSCSLVSLFWWVSESQYSYAKG